MRRMNIAGLELLNRIPRSIVYLNYPLASTLYWMFNISDQELFDALMYAWRLEIPQGRTTDEFIVTLRTIIEGLLARMPCDSVTCASDGKVYTIRGAFTCIACNGTHKRYSELLAKLERERHVHTQEY
jgi:hypothetical protein